MKVRVIVGRYNQAWVIGKMAARLVENLREIGVEATLANEPDEAADVNHWMSWAMVRRRSGRVSTMFITHLDDPYQTSHVAKSLRELVDVGLCMSRDMMRALVHWGIPAKSLWYVLPAHDPPPPPPPIRVAMMTNLYADGRKREALLVRLAAERDLSSFHFEIAGNGWDGVVERLRKAGASVEWTSYGSSYQADYEPILERIRTCEWYLYLGMDEGSLGTLDALAMGLKTIITAQGFHLDLSGGIQEAVVSYDELRSVFDRLVTERERRLGSVRGWTWRRFAEDHVLVWEELLLGNAGRLSTTLRGRGRYPDSDEMPPGPGLTRRTWRGYYARAVSLKRIVAAIWSMRLLQPLLDPLRRMARR